MDKTIVDTNGTSAPVPYISLDALTKSAGGAK
jgi:hypothetical protein